MNGQQAPAPRRSGAGGVIGLVLVVLLVIGWFAAHTGQQATITTCTDTVTPSCYQTTVPVQAQAP